ncbi:HAD family hydrolase [Streptomyces microflavus]|uniref:Uncharacterized protein n=1 Tax=Streptomyces microflavus TaxID=1919 RepID=A0A7H8N0G0_STRMI|nr:hypothetical protein [Streptomyces microflavus]QKW47899.1 hypothetical protein HUT09_35865 [Streptomyces microflavus]
MLSAREEVSRRPAQRPLLGKGALRTSERESDPDKLQVFGLDTHIRFPYGGYGDRAELVRTAITRTRHATTTPFTEADVLLIGDTPADIAAAARPVFASWA